MPRRSWFSSKSSLSFVLPFLVLWLTGADLRLTVLAVPPVLPLIHHQFALSERAIGALSGLPVLLFGLVAVPGSLLIARLGPRRATIVALLLVAAASVTRGVGPSVPMLFTMTCIMAAGVAIVQPALPALVVEWFASRPDFATAVYANGLLIGEAAPAALTIPLVLPLVGDSWPASFAVWAVPVAATAALIPLCPHRSTPAVSGSAAPPPLARWWPDWRSRQTWQLGLMLGGTGGLYFASNAFIPDYLHAVGRPDLVTVSLSALNLGQFPASLVLLAMARRLGGKAMVAGMQIVGLFGVATFLATDPWLGVVGAGVIGFCCAFTLIVTLALPPRLVAAADVHRLSAGMFAIGYTLSCLVPLVGGMIWDATGRPAAAFVAPVCAAAIVLGAALGFRFPD